MNEIIALIAAVLGSSGIASLVTNGALFRRTHRLQRQIAELNDTYKLMDENSMESTALKAARTHLCLELTAQVMIRGRTWIVSLLYFMGLLVLLTMGFAIIETAQIKGPVRPRLDGAEISLEMAAFNLVGSVIIVIAGTLVQIAVLWLTAAKWRRSLVSRLLHQEEGTTPGDILQWVENDLSLRGRLRKEIKKLKDTFRRQKGGELPGSTSKTKRSEHSAERQMTANDAGAS